MTITDDNGTHLRLTRDGGDICLQVFTSEIRLTPAEAHQLSDELFIKSLAARAVPGVRE